MSEWVMTKFEDVNIHFHILYGLCKENYLNSERGIADMYSKKVYNQHSLHEYVEFVTSNSKETFKPTYALNKNLTSVYM